MGVKNLWPILEDALEYTDKNIPVQCLRGKRVAVDLSSWVVEFQRVRTGQTFIKNLYIRSLYYRTTELLGYGIKLIFVADGTAPEMKAAVIKKRLETQEGTSSSSTDCSRANFRAMIEKCEELLKFLGVPFVYSDGEGEALCAALNAKGKVDAVMTSDVDAFLYGATTVYRNYRTQSGIHYIDIYKMQKIQSKLGLDRRSLVVCALLAGCDFCAEGLEGVGIAKAVAFIESAKKLGQDPLDRMCGWKVNKELQDLDKVVKSKHCSNCDHEGERSRHKYEGCGYCGTSVSCLSYKPNPTTKAAGSSTPKTNPNPTTEAATSPTNLNRTTEAATITRTNPNPMTEAAITTLTNPNPMTEAVVTTPTTNPNPTTEAAITTPTTKPCQCSWHHRKNHELELKLWSKAMTDETFPKQKIINEYLEQHQDLESLDLTFRPIDVGGAKIFMTTYFPSMNTKPNVGEFYTNMATVLVQLQLHNMTDSLKPSTTLKPVKIIQTRRKLTVHQLEVHWSKLDEDNESKVKCYTVLSETKLFKEKFPEMTSAYFEEVQRKRGAKRQAQSAVGESSSELQPSMKQFFKVVK